MRRFHENLRTGAIIRLGLPGPRAGRQLSVKVVPDISAAGVHLHSSAPPSTIDVTQLATLDMSASFFPAIGRGLLVGQR